MASKREKSLRTTLGLQVRRLRDDLGINQEELASPCDLSRDMISRIERGAIACSLETIAKLSEVFNISAAMLFGGFPISDNPKSQREKLLSQINRVLATVDTKDLPWLQQALEVILRRSR
jgi:transcriptional regulator with XRE-family HTH domain